MIRKSVVTMIAGGLLAAAPAKAEWVEASSDHFLVYANMSQQEAKAFATRLERVDRLLRTIVKAPDTAAERANRVTVYFVPDIASVQKLYGGRGDVGGFYRGSAQGSLAVTPKSAGGSEYLQPQEVLFHEYTHAILIGNSRIRYPKWLSEGMAEFFGTVDARDDGSLVLGAPPKQRGFALAQTNQMDADELLTADQRRLSGLDDAHLYARGWALVHYLLLTPGRAGQLDRYLDLIGNNVPSLDAGRQAFGDLGKLDRDIKVHLRAAKFQGIEVPASKLPIGTVTVRPLSACAARIMPIRIRSAVGVNEKTASIVASDARRAAAGCENDAFVQRALAETEFDAKDNAAAMAAADRALARDPANLGAMLYKGRVYARAKDWANARKWFVKANRQDPNHALPMVLYYDSFVNAGQAPTEAARNGVLRALVLVPQDPSVRIRAVRALVAQGDLQTARAALVPLALAPHTKADSAEAQILRLIDEGKDSRTVLAAIDKAKWNEVGQE